MVDSDIVADAAAILALNEQIKAIEMRIEATAKECSMARRLRAILGFGVIGPAELSGEIGSLHPFDTEASLALYLGMAPLDHSSGLRALCFSQNIIRSGVVQANKGVTISPPGRSCRAWQARASSRWKRWRSPF